MLLDLLSGHQANLPDENRLWHNQKPLPSYTNNLTAVFNRLRKTKMWPLKDVPLNSKYYFLNFIKFVSLPSRSRIEHAPNG